MATNLIATDYALFISVCGGSLFVQDEVVIDAATFENCVWEIRTQNDHVLAFTIVNGDLASPQDFLSVIIFLEAVVFCLIDSEIVKHRFTMALGKIPKFSRSRVKEKVYLQPSIRHVQRLKSVLRMLPLL